MTITTPGNLIIQGGAVTVFSLGEGDAGNLEVVAGSIRLDEKGLLNAGAPLSNGGNITLQVQDLLLMRHNSQISTSAGTPQKGGNGGNITIKAPLIVAVPSENSDITARAVRGRGGNINITALGIYGIESRQELTPLSDINASFDYGVSGTVQINTLVIDPGLAELPTDLVDAEELVDRRCTATGGAATSSSFTVPGRGGLPPTPKEALSTDAAWEDWRFAEDSEQPRARQTIPIQSSAATSDRQLTKANQQRTLVEATGWIFDAKGNVVLTAEPTTVTPHGSPLNPPTCQQLTSNLSSRLTNVP